jgi:hypothetical protein
MNVIQLRDRLDQLIGQGHGNKPVVFGPEGPGAEHPIEGGIVAADQILLAPLKLDKVGGF